MVTTDNELRAQLREQGIEDVPPVKKVFMEEDGEVSFIKKE